MSGRCLLLDAGNTRLKWALLEDGAWREQGACGYEALAALESYLAADTGCYIASVAAPENEQRLAALLEAASVAACWLRAEAAFADLKNDYADPRQLGVDRWMGLIAARRRTRGPVLVVSAGTAMTVDAMSADGVFLGGLIVPGARLMRQALQLGTARVGDVAGAWQAFPRTTADAVQSGIVAALCGAIQQQHARLADLAGTVPACLLTGGDAETLRPHLSVAAELAPALVLEGLACVAAEKGRR